MSGWPGAIDNIMLRIGGPTEQGGEFVRGSPYFLPRIFQTSAETELRRRDVESRDDVALEVSNRRRRPDQTKLELFINQRIPPCVRSYNPLVQLINVAHRVGPQLAELNAG